MTDEGSTVGIWVGADEDVVEEFDSTFGDEAGYSRSDTIKEAMRMYLSIESVVSELDYELTPEQVKRSWVRQALHDRVRKEARDDS